MDHNGSEAHPRVIWVELLELVNVVTQATGNVHDERRIRRGIGAFKERIFHRI